MTYMFEAYYRPPVDPGKEAAVARQVAEFGGRLDYREEPTGDGYGGICLTYEFSDYERAEAAADSLRRSGIHVEGPGAYGD